MPLDARLSPPDVPETTTSAVPHPPVPLPPPRRPHPSDDDPISMTTEMEVISEDVQKRRGIDHTLARFSAVHDELQAEEREKKAKRRKLMPWQNADEEFEHLDEMVASQTMAVPVPRETAPPEAFEQPGPERNDSDKPAGATRLQAKKSRRQRRVELTLKVVALTAAVLVFVAVGVAWGFKSWIESNAKQVDALDPNSDAIKDAAAQNGDENFLLVGSDTRAGAAAEEGVGDENEVVGARSDTVMIAHVPANRERVVVVSFPRDLEVTRPECEGWDPKTGEYTGKQNPAQSEVKINTAYQVGGPKCVTKMVQELSGLKINHFVGIDFHGFKDMVNAVDGVEVCVERPLEDDVLGTVVPEAGTNVTITGDQALNFVRARHVKGDPTSDYGRIIRQQRFLSSLLRKAMSSEVLLDTGKLTNFVEAFSKSTFGDNIGVDQLFTLGQSMQGVAAGRVTFITIPTVGEANENGNEDLRTEDTNALFEAIRADTPLPGEAPAGGEGEQAGTNQASGGQQVSGLLQEQPVNPAGIKIQVLNGGNPTDGIATDTAEELGELGFDVMQVGAAPENVDRTIIKYAKSSEAQARTLAAAVPDAELVEDPSMAGALLLVIGPGFDGEVVAPTGGGGQPAPEVPDNLSTVNAGDVSCA
jgi:LCP family protein required for cell wall assembly